MMYSIRYTPQAQRDMDAVWDGVYKASLDTDTADRYVDEFVDMIEEKREFPHSGIPLGFDGLFTGYYSVNYKAYKAFYRVRDSFVEVLRIVLMKQDFMKILFDLPFPEQNDPDGQVLQEPAGAEQGRESAFYSQAIPE